MKTVNLTPRFWVAAGLVAFTLVVGLIGPLLVSTDPDAVTGGLYDPPGGGLETLLGTDNEGQSVLANLVYGTRTSLVVGLVAGLIASAIGLVLGLVAGYQGGVVDDVIAGVTNVALAIPSIVLIILLGIALKTLPVGTGYAVWTGIGAVGTAAMGILLLGESMEPMRLASIGLIVAGIIGLKVTSPV